MKPLHDWRCNMCDNTFEFRAYNNECVKCERCGISGASRIYLSSPAVKAGDYDAYDSLDRVIPDSKQIKSFATDHRKGGKDTT